MAGKITPQQLERDLARLGSRHAVAREYGIGATTVFRMMQRWGLSSPHPRAGNTAQQQPAAPTPAGVDIGTDTATVTLPAHPKRGGLRSVEQVLHDHGLDPERWEVVSYADNYWDAPTGEGDAAPLSQSKVVARRKAGAEALLPARCKGWRPSMPRGAAPKRAGELVLCVSDTHAPYHDPGLHDCLLQWLRWHQPDRAFDFGDLLDLPIPSRHRTTQGFEASPQESIDARYRIDAERVAASPRTAWTVCLGNHDERIDHAVRDKNGASVARIARANDSIPVLDLGFLLRYDELGIELLRPTGDYHSVSVEIAPGLFGRHGTKAGKHGGAVKVIEKHAGSVGQGHDHKQVHQQVVRYDEQGRAQARWALSWGAMCERDLGYVEDPDVAQGFTTITVHEDGSWHPEIAKYDAAARTLFWRDERYVATDHADM